MSGRHTTRTVYVRGVGATLDSMGERDSVGAAERERAMSVLRRREGTSEGAAPFRFHWNGRRADEWRALCSLATSRKEGGKLRWGVPSTGFLDGRTCCGPPCKGTSPSEGGERDSARIWEKACSLSQNETSGMDETGESGREGERQAKCYFWWWRDTNYREERPSPPSCLLLSLMGLAKCGSATRLFVAAAFHLLMPCFTLARSADSPDGAHLPGYKMALSYSAHRPTDRWPDCRADSL